MDSEHEVQRNSPKSDTIKPEHETDDSMTQITHSDTNKFTVDSKIIKRQNSQLQDLVTKYKEKYPNHYISIPNTKPLQRRVNFELQPYPKLRSSPNLAIIVQRLIMNYVSHLSTNQDRLDATMELIRGDHMLGLLSRNGLFAEFAKRSELSGKVEDEIAKSDVTKHFLHVSQLSSDSSQFKHQRETLLYEGKTELQVILRTSDAICLESARCEWTDPWHLVNLTLCFQLFKRSIFDSAKSFSKDNELHGFKKTDHEVTYKKRYIEYMQEVAESNQEFILAIISAFGTDPRKYPGKVIEFLDMRRMLNISASADKVVLQSLNTDSIIPLRNASYFQNLDTGVVESMKAYEIGGVCELYQHSKFIKKKKKIKSQIQPFELEILGFESCMSRLWSTEHRSNRIPKEILSIWHNRFLLAIGTFRKDLNACIQALQADGSGNRKYNIVQFTSKEIRKMKLDQSMSEIENVGVKGTRSSGSNTDNGETFHEKMKQVNSSLQLALVDPMLVQWNLEDCDIPFHAFDGYMQGRLNSLSSAPKRLDAEVVKLRYVEFLAQHVTHAQFLLGVYTAYGLNIFSYPIRVVQLINSKELLRSGSSLQTFVENFSMQKKYAVLKVKIEPAPSKQPESRFANKRNGTEYGGNWNHESPWTKQRRNY